MAPMFIPGPVDVPEEVLAAQLNQMLPHRSKEFEAIFQRAAQKAKLLFATQDPVFLTASSGTGWQEACVRNLAKERVLCCVNGAFGMRWYEVALANGKSAHKLETPWNQPITPSLLFEALRHPPSSQPYELVTIVHNETSTGLMNPIEDLAGVARQASPDTLICVDAVSSLGGVRIDKDRWGIDVLFTSSQKCLALPPGMALAAVSPRALEYARHVPQRGWYFDLLRLEQHLYRDSTPATPPMPLIYALDVQLDRILAEGLEQRFARHRAMAERVQAWAPTLGFELYAPLGYRSHTVTTLVNTPKIEVSQLNAYLMTQGMRIASGYGPLKKDTLRIAHMGETQLQELEQLLAAITAYLEGSRQ